MQTLYLCRAQFTHSYVDEGQKGCMELAEDLVIRHST